MNTKAIENSALFKFLGAEDAADLRQMVKEVIVERIRNDLENSSEWIIEPDDIIRMLNDVAEEAVREIKDDYKQRLSEAIARKLGNLDL